IQTAEKSILKSRQEEQFLFKELDSIKNSLQQKNSECQSLTAALSKVSIRNDEKEKASLDTAIEDIIGATAHWKLLSLAISEKDKLQQALKTNKEALERNNAQAAEAQKLLDNKTLEKTASLKMLEKAKLAAAQSVD